jgi:hypothetical protein
VLAELADGGPMGDENHGLFGECLEQAFKELSLGLFVK